MLAVFPLCGVLVVAILIGRLLARGTGIPDAAAYALIGLLAGLMPWLPATHLSPDVVLLLFLPPLIYYAAFFSDPRESLRYVAPIVGQSVGLVLVTAAAAAGCLLLVFPGIGWAAALAFGAAIAPPDPVATTGMLERLGVPRRLVTVLEGEGLVNDGAALTLFGLAIANLGAPPSSGDIALRIGLGVGGGLVFGLAVGALTTWLRTRIHEVPSQVVLSLATPYLAFVPAQAVHASGVLATVVAAAWQGTRGRGLVAPTARLPTETFWRVLNLLLVATLFVLLGLQVPDVVRAVASFPVGATALAALAVVLVAVLVRLGWALAVLPLLATLHRRRGPAERMPVAERIVLGWCGPRGAVSLAVALSIPLTTPDGAPFGWRPLLVFLTSVVVLATLVGQILPLPALLRRLELSRSEPERTEALRARRVAVDAVLRELDDIAEHHDGGDDDHLEALRQAHQLRRDRPADELDQERRRHTENTTAGNGEQSLRLRLLRVERAALHRMRERGEISARTLVVISQELDLDETRLRGPG